MIELNSEFRLKKSGNGFELLRKKLKTHTGQVGTDKYRKLEIPKETWTNLEIYPSDEVSALRCIKRIYKQECADSEKVFDINELIDYIKEKCL